MDQFVLMYMDDILIYSENEADYVKHVNQVFSKLRGANLRVKKEKSEFHVREVEFLGYRIKPGTVQMVREKVDKVDFWPEPKNEKDVQKFLGFVGFYQNMVKGYVQVVAPLTDLLRKDKRFV